MRWPKFRKFRGWRGHAFGCWPIVIHGSCMAPEFPPGSIAFVDPRIPVEDGDYALLYFGDAVHGTSGAIKRVWAPRGWSKAWEFEQLNPPERGPIGDHVTTIGPVVCAWVLPEWMRCDDRAVTDAIDRETAETIRA